MEPFKIICVTCQAKLSVNNASLIGQVLACPRCESMVEITPPTGAVAAASTEPVPVVEEVAPAVTATAIVPDEVSVPNVEAEILQASAEVAKYKMMVWSLAGVLVGAVLVGAVLYSRRDSSTEATALVPNTLEPAPVIEIINPPAVETLLVEPAPIVETPSTVTPVVEVAVPALKEPVSEVVGPSVPPAPIDEQPIEVPEIARRFDPLDFDPESLTLAAVDKPTESVEPPASESQDEVIEMPEEVPSTLPSARRGPDGGEDASERDAEQQLDLLIPGVAFKQLPLVDFLRLISHLSGVPVSVSPEQLLMAGITPQKKVTLTAKKAGLNFVLNKVLEPLHLEYSARGSQVVVTRQDATKQREINYPIDDLVGDATSLEELVGWVEQLVAPATWKTAGGEGTLETSSGKLRIRQTQQAQYQVLIFLERLRLARNLSPRSRYPVKRLAGTPASALLQEQLANRTTFTFSQYTPIDDVFVHWQTEIGVPLLIDWPALEEANIWPATTVACAILDQPWSVALEKVLEPLGLGWRAATGGAIEITSAEKVRSELQLELYPLRGEGEFDGEFDGDVGALFVLAKPQAAGGIVYDPVGKVLLVLQPASTQRLIFRRLREQGLFGE